MRHINPMDHFRKLERMYLSAPINAQVYEGISIAISKEHAELTLPIIAEYHHRACA